ncbi:hypothetical protein [Chromobacterium paludis]|uniref:Acyl carrier protein n=1 Tax=Chromobacterium paludis TaxID=2605945 RepID=A0A5C1DIQ3_9NEIS|nr:hypothetical protein [Chromobacterium paludis]QEL56621.1 hypothetical protein FYK34_14120 [Chromobacterium paludis]
MDKIESWIREYFREEGVTELDAERPLFEQVDSFHVVGFMLACEETYDCFRAMGADAFTGLTLGRIAALIDEARAA